MLPSHEYIIEFGSNATMKELEALCKSNIGLRFVVVSNIAPASVVNLYSHEKNLSPFRLDYSDIGINLITSIGLMRDPLEWGYAGKSGIAVIPLFYPVKKLEVWVKDKQTIHYSIINGK
jgi:hypothetical protein